MEFGEGNLETQRLTHRERIEACINGDVKDRTPIALWRHFPIDDQTPESLAEAIINFQRTYEFDLVKVTPSSSFCLTDWGAKDEWRGSTEGTRDYTHRVIQQPEDWSKLPILDPTKGALGDQIKCLKLICDELGPDVPILQTIFNPLSQAKNLVGGQKLLAHIRQYPDAVQQGLKIITETTRAFIEAACKLPIDGIFYAVQHGSFQLLSPEEYRIFGRDDDLALLKVPQHQWLNMLHLHGDAIMFKQFTDYPVQIINWHDRETYPSLSEGKDLYPGVVCGGLQRIKTMELGTPELVYAEGKQAIQETGNQRFILGTGCVLPITVPRANILAAIKSCNL